MSNPTREAKTLIDLELAATLNNGIASYQIRKTWLIVRMNKSPDKLGTYTYQYGDHELTREGAEIIMDGG